MKKYEIQLARRAIRLSGLFLFIVILEKSTGKFGKSMKPQMKAKLYDNPELRFRIQEVEEDPAMSKDENVVSITEKMQELLKLFDVKPGITVIDPLGKFDKDSEDPMTVLVLL